MLNSLLVQHHQFIIHVTMQHMWHHQHKTWQTKFSQCGPLLCLCHKKIRNVSFTREKYSKYVEYGDTPLLDTCTLIRMSIFFYPNWMDTYTLYTLTHTHIHVQSQGSNIFYTSSWKFFNKQRQHTGIPSLLHISLCDKGSSTLHFNTCKVWLGHTTKYFPDICKAEMSFFFISTFLLWGNNYLTAYWML